MDETRGLYARKIWIGIVSGLGVAVIVLAVILFLSVKKHKKIIHSLEAEVRGLRVETEIFKVQKEKEKELVRLERMRVDNLEEHKKREDLKKQISQIQKKEDTLKKEASKIKKEVSAMPIKEALKEAKKVLEETL